MARTTPLGLGRAACCVWLAAGALGCTVETSTKSLDDSNLDEASQQLEQFIDRPAVAAVGVMGQTGRDLWLFACKSNHTLFRQVYTGATQVFGPWVQASSVPCAGVPTAGAWQHLPTDHVEVFYRSTAGDLIEVGYGDDGVGGEANLSILIGSLGHINGDPVIADMGRDTTVAVAVRDAGNFLTTVSFRNRIGWVKQLVTNWSGVPVHADGLLTALYTPYQTYLSSSLNGVYRVFTRTVWNNPYLAINSTISNPRGVLTFTAPTPTSMLVIGRDGSDRITKSWVADGVDWNFTLANRVSVLSTPHMGASWSYDAARTSTYDRGIGYDNDVALSTIWSLNNTQTVAHAYAGTPLRSAGIRPVNAGDGLGNFVFLASTPSYRLNAVYLANELDLLKVTDLGINVLVP
jgi:hypothetical protein